MIVAIDGKLNVVVDVIYKSITKVLLSIFILLPIPVYSASWIMACNGNSENCDTTTFVIGISNAGVDFASDTIAGPLTGNVNTIQMAYYTDRNRTDTGNIDDWRVEPEAGVGERRRWYIEGAARHPNVSINRATGLVTVGAISENKRVFVRFEYRKNSTANTVFFFGDLYFRVKTPGIYLTSGYGLVIENTGSVATYGAEIRFSDGSPYPFANRPRWSLSDETYASINLFSGVLSTSDIGDNTIESVDTNVIATFRLPADEDFKNYYPDFSGRAVIPIKIVNIPPVDDARIGIYSSTPGSTFMQEGIAYGGKGDSFNFGLEISRVASESYTPVAEYGWDISPKDSGATIDIFGSMQISDTLSENKEFIVSVPPYEGVTAPVFKVRARARLPVGMVILRGGVEVSAADNPSFDEGSSLTAEMKYSARLDYDDATSVSVSPVWDELDASIATISSSGQLTTYDVMADTASAITAIYFIGDATYYPEFTRPLSATRVFTIINQQDFTVEINRPTPIKDNNSEGYPFTVEAIMNNDGSRVPITPVWSVTNLSGQSTSVATIDASGVLRTHVISQDTQVIVSVDFTYLGDRVMDSIPLLIEKIWPLAITITGDSAVAEQNSTDYQYTANATIPDGSRIQVNPEWSVTSLTGQPTSLASIDELGFLTTSSVNQTEQLIVHASFTYLGVTANAQQTVTVNDSDKLLGAISINGPSTLMSGSSAAYTAAAIYENTSSSSINSSDVIWSVSGSEAVSIDPSGVVTVATVNQKQLATIQALYTIGGMTKKAEMIVSIDTLSAQVHFIERVSVASDGTEADNDSYADLSISADGRYVAFMSGATNLLGPGVDTNGMQDIFVHDRELGITARVSIASDGTQADNHSDYEPSISADGRYVAFTSRATTLLGPGVDTNGRRDIFVHDRELGITARVSVASDGSQADNHSDGGPSISADGRYVAFMSGATNLLGSGVDTNGRQDIFVHDRELEITARVSVASDGSQADNLSVYAPSISADGRYVAFNSYATNLGSEVDTNGRQDTFVHDRELGTTARVSIASDGSQADNDSIYAPSISADGRYVSFTSEATNLLGPGVDTNGGLDTFVHDRELGMTTRVSVASDGTQADNFSGYGPSISADGRYVAFISRATNLLESGGIVRRHVYVVDRDPDSSQVSVQLNATSSTRALGEQLVVEIHMESNDIPLIGGGLNINYDTSLLDFVSFTPNPALVLDSAFGREPDITTTGVTLNGLAFGEFEGLSGSQLIGTLTFNPLSTGIADLTLSDNSLTGPMGAFYMVDGTKPEIINYIGTSITITDNAVPVASNLSITANAGVAQSGNMVATDNDVSDQLIYQLADMPGKGIVDIDNPTSGAFTYTPFAGASGADSFTYQASDGKQSSNIATVTVTINDNIAAAPVANTAVISTDEDVAYSGTLVASDDDSPVLAYRMGTNGQQGTAVIIDANAGTFRYTPNLNANGSDSFTFIANDGTQDSNTATISVTINPVNDAPVAINGSLTTNQDAFTSGMLSASDIDGDATTYHLDPGKPATLGMVVINSATGAYTYTPDAGIAGIDSFGFYANDGVLNSNIGTVSITINAASPQNQPPVAYSDNISTTEGSVVTANIIANDQDADQDALFIASVDTASSNGGIIVNNGDGTVTYTPPAAFWGGDTFSYQVTDGMATVTGEVNVTIAAENSTEIRVNAGGSTVIDSSGRTWAADYGFNNTGIAAGIANPIDGKEVANDAYIYQTERTTNRDLSTISYRYDVPNGEYHVILHFADTYFWLNGQRVFNVSVEDQPLINNLDIISEVSYNAPLTERFDVLVSDGTINIDFMPVSEIPVINAIEIIAKGISRLAIPGKFQAEDYNSGVNGVAYNDIWSGNDGGIYRRDDVDIGKTHDIDGGYKVGWTQDNEWLKYDVFVAETGFYDIDIRTSNPSVDWYWGRMKLELDGVDLTNLLIAPLTASSDLFDETSARKIALTAGSHTLKLVINQGGIDVNWLKFSRHTSFDIPGRIEAEDYGHDGSGVSYFDSSPGNYADWYRHDGVDVDITSDVGGGYKIAWIADNEWLKYDVTITTSGTYNIEFRVSKGDANDAVFHLERDGVDITGPMIVSGSGTYDWNMFNTITANNVYLTEGTASLKIVIDQPSMDINWMQFILVSPN